MPDSNLREARACVRRHRVTRTALLALAALGAAACDNDPAGPPIGERDIIAIDGVPLSRTHASLATELTFTSSAFEDTRAALEGNFTAPIYDLPDHTMAGEVAFVGRGCTEGVAEPDPYLADPAGKIALIERGVCTFESKIRRAQQAGAIGAIIYNNPEATDPESVLRMGGAGGTVQIPGIFVALSTGLLLRESAPPVLATARADLAPDLTPTGTEVTVAPTDQTTGDPSPVEVTFENVTAEGTTTVTSGTVGGGSGPPPPANFRLGSPPTYYDIETTAAYDGSITICLSYDGVQYGNEQQLKLLHGETDEAGNLLGWVDVTTSLDTENNIICGTVTALSPFLAAEENAAPVVTEIRLPPSPIALGFSAEITASFTDANPGDQHTATIDWQAITTPGDVIEANGSGTVAGAHTYLEPGVYTVGLIVRDGNLAGSRTSAVDVPAFIVVYDPNGGFVTGGGWIDSPPGAYVPAPDVSGKATFGFVARYRPGATTPSGHTAFQFKSADLHFESTSYDWLVISGPRAQYKGTGTINGTGTYRFLLTAVDGQASEGEGVDRFRIRIWDASGVVYDNEMESSADSDAASVLGGGSIVIHTK